jgi:hypothetical protein
MIAALQMTIMSKIVFSKKKQFCEFKVLLDLVLAWQLLEPRLLRKYVMLITFFRLLISWSMKLQSSDTDPEIFLIVAV